MLEYLSVEGTGDGSEFYLRMWLTARRDSGEAFNLRKTLNYIRRQSWIR